MSPRYVHPPFYPYPPYQYQPQPPYFYGGYLNPFLGGFFGGLTGSLLTPILYDRPPYPRRYY